jgi:hypothetical protein
MPRTRATATHCSQGHEWTQESMYVNPSNGQRSCRVCQREYSRTSRRRQQRTEWYRSGGKEQMQLQRRAKVFGLTPEQWEAMNSEQDGRCAICRGVSKGRPLDVDHDHSTGTVRALLCRKCNLALGYVGDSIEILESMIQYLRQHHQEDVVR